MAGRRDASRAEGPSRDAAYARRLDRLSGAWWKRWLDVQAPYRWNLRRLAVGRTLEVGCGIGRNLRHLGSRAVGVDPNRRAVEIARGRGCDAWTPEAFAASPQARAQAFDTLLFAHVLEHLPRSEAEALLGTWLPYLRPGGTVLLVTPQEAGFRSDPTHVTFLDFEALETLLATHGLRRTRRLSFPLPRACGRVFRHNEFVVTGRRPEV